MKATEETGAKGDLAAEVVRQFGEVSLRVTGTSMLPSVWPGDILTVRRREAAEVRPGQILLCYRDRQFVAHRLVARRGDGLITRGDSLPYYDEPFREDEVLGQVVKVMRRGRAVDPSPNRWYCGASWILRHSELCTRMLLRLRQDLWAS